MATSANPVAVGHRLRARSYNPKALKNEGGSLAHIDFWQQLNIVTQRRECSQQSLVLFHSFLQAVSTFVVTNVYLRPEARDEDGGGYSVRQ